MTGLTYGDLASAFQSTRYQSTLKADLTRLSKEISSGLTADISKTVNGEFSTAAAIEHSLKTLEATSRSVTVAVERSGTTQLALGVIQDSVQLLSNQMITASGTTGQFAVDTLPPASRGTLETVVSALNTNVSGRYLFSGAGSDQPALQSADDMLTSISAAVSGYTTAGDVSAAIDDWFDMAGGQFETTGYLGSTTDQGALRLGEGQSAKLEVRADDTSIRSTLKALVKSAVIDDPSLSLSNAEKMALHEIATLETVGAVGAITTTRSQVGLVEAQADSALARVSAQTTSLELSRLSLLGVDQYEAATKLEGAYNQLESLYSVTAKLSRLRFTDYM